jgi:hypothetical protein
VLDHRSLVFLRGKLEAACTSPHVFICPLSGAQMEWHSGYTLSQTIFSFLYVHSLKDIDPDLIPGGSPPRTDTLRPPELITVVLRAAIVGLLKCCDLTWRELNKGNVYDVRSKHRLSSKLYLSATRRRTGKARNVTFLSPRLYRSNMSAGCLMKRVIGLRPRPKV